MSKRYFNQRSRTSADYNNAYDALYDYCHGWRSLFNPKRWALRRILNGLRFSSRTNDGVINAVLYAGELNGKKPLKTNNISRTSKLAAVFSVIYEETKNLRESYKTKIQKDIVKLDKDQREDTIVSLLRRYSAPWPKRLFTGEIGNRHVPEIRRALFAYNNYLSKYDMMDRYTGLINDLNNINTENDQVLNSLVSYINKFENDNTEDTGEVDTYQSESENQSEESEKNEISFIDEASSNRTLSTQKSEEADPEAKVNDETEKESTQAKQATYDQQKDELIKLADIPWQLLGIANEESSTDEASSEETSSDQTSEATLPIHEQIKLADTAWELHDIAQDLLEKEGELRELGKLLKKVDEIQRDLMEEVMTDKEIKKEVTERFAEAIRESESEMRENNNELKEVKENIDVVLKKFYETVDIETLKSNYKSNIYVVEKLHNELSRAEENGALSLNCLKKNEPKESKNEPNKVTLIETTEKLLGKINEFQLTECEGKIFESIDEINSCILQMKNQVDLNNEFQEECKDSLKGSLRISATIVDKWSSNDGSEKIKELNGGLASESSSSSFYL